jgi:cytidine deaminase
MNYYTFAYTEFESLSALSSSHQEVLIAAQQATALAYAPYSQFKVGAAILLSNGAIVKGSNQENAAYPSGICAERVGLATVSSLYPRETMVSIAIAYHNGAAPNNKQLSPCGMCRQSLMEYAQLQPKQPIQVIMSATDGSGIVVADCRLLLPFGFEASMISVV